MRVLTFKLTRNVCIIAFGLNPEKIIIVRIYCSYDKKLTFLNISNKIEKGSSRRANDMRD